MRVLPATGVRRCSWVLAGLALALALAAAPAAQAQGWGGAVGLTSDYVYRGLTQSDHEPAAQLDLHYYSRPGWYAGLWTTSVKRDPDDSITAEFDPYLGFQWPLAQDWSGRIAAVYHDYPWSNPGHHYNNPEFSGSLAYSDRAFVTVAYSPNTLVETRYGDVSGHAAISYELALNQPLPYAFSLNGGVGYYDLHQVLDTGYIYWNAGLGYQLGRAQLNLSYIGTDSTARYQLSEGLAVNRLVVAVIYHF